MEYLLADPQFFRAIRSTSDPLKNDQKVDPAESRQANAQPEQPIAPDPDRASIEEQEKALYDFFRRLATRRVREGKYKTHDLVELVGGFKTHEKQVSINGLGPIHLSMSQFAVLLVLAAHARTLQKLSTPREIKGGTFLSSKEILDEIDAWRKEQPALIGPEDKSSLHRAIFDLREKIRIALGNPNLIETGEAGQGGYRLSTPAFNIVILFR